jgi:hypothetical protein
MLCCFVGLFLQNSKVVSYKNCFFLTLMLACALKIAEPLKTICLHSQFETRR